MQGVFYPTLYLLVVGLGAVLALHRVFKAVWGRVEHGRLVGLMAAPLALMAASTLLTLAVAMLFFLYDRKPIGHGDVTGFLLGQFIWCLPSACFYGLLIQCLKSRLVIRHSFAIEAAALLLLFAAGAAFLPLRELGGVLGQLLFGLVPMSILATVQTITISLGEPVPVDWIGQSRPLRSLGLAALLLAVAAARIVLTGARDGSPSCCDSIGCSSGCGEGS